MEFGNPMSPILRKAALAAAALVLLGCSASPTGESTLLLNSPEQMNTLGRQSFEQLKALADAPPTAVGVPLGEPQYQRLVAP